MKQLYTKRRLLFLVAILIISNLVITGISLIVIYKKSITSLETNLLDVVERQKALIITLQNSGKKSDEIIHFLKQVQSKHFGVGNIGEFAIAQRFSHDSVIFLIASRVQQHQFNIYNPEKYAWPMRLAMEGNNGFVVAKDYEGIDVFAAYTNIPSLQWGIVAKVPVAGIKEPYFRAMYIAFFISIILISFCVYLFYIVSSPLLKSLVNSEKTYKMLFESINDAIFISELKSDGSLGKFIQVNDIACKRLGYSRNELLDKTPLDINSENSKTSFDLKVAELNNKKHAIIETEHVKKDGSIIPVEVSTKVTQFEGKTIFHSVARDITERKQNELLLQEKTDFIESQNEEFQQINEELVETNQELISAMERAEKSDRLKTAFLQNMSHEIRTPMNAIMGFSDLLLENFNNKDKLEKFASIIRQRSSDLLEIISDVLDISMIESGHAPINLERCNLDSIFSEVMLFFKAHKQTLGKQHIKLELQIDCGNDKSILIDKVKIKQIFINLIGNAFKFTQEGSIKLGCNYGPDQDIVFYVSDTGIGIPKDKTEFIFERFAQLEQTPSYLYGGTGLGLSIVKGLIDLLGGKIWVKSEVNIGTTFYFSFPYRVEEGIYSDEINEQYDYKEFESSGKTVLIVEDDLFNADYLKEILSNYGFNILHTIYGEEAVQLVKINEIDLVLMDIRLPDINGYEVTQQMKEIKSNLKIIAQTAYASSDDKKRSKESGCDDYISKPINGDLLLSKISQQLMIN